MKHFIAIMLLSILVLPVTAQKAYTKTGSISFFSKAPLENISASNNQVMSVLNQQTGELQFSVIIKSFKFQKALMEEHFNENYMESDKYPKAAFKGTIVDFSKVNFSKDGACEVSVSGDLTIHGITNKISIPASISIKSGIATASSKFKIRLADYKITIPRLVKDNISETVDLTVSCNYSQKL